MKKKIIVLLVVLGLVIIAFVGVRTFFLGSSEVKKQIAIEGKEYLINSESYKPDDILSVEGVYSYKTGTYDVQVKFSDEPEVYYTYRKESDTKFQQVGTTNLEGKHLKKNLIDNK
ncbi:MULTISPECIES: DUF3139 domain-containing protein [Paenibacillus]|uniref:DUF3139 domain-containing protein n=2 Tax=Paenibacillus TaxID=44249 RepID=A0ABX2ZHP6_PAEPO|nr:MULTISPECIES: DUF3139 domain-containing protein [Paenibacillus]MDR6781437.1 flagellar basal body-associated protein FliL [Paenibacillus peoriae]ODA08188.1 hypothetical protein A7312_28125 [Paenibacillus polymyxa]OME64506.1 hypothetical protein BK119_26320 [Paenibacillus peoriae]